jgi:thioredoxin reductase
MIPSGVARLDLAEMPIALHLDDGRRVKASTIVVATGARYRRLDALNLRDFEGRGVWYWASPIEARLCRDEEIVLVGGGNSAGQSAVFLRSFAKKIWMLVRDKSGREHVAISDRPHPRDRQYRSIDPHGNRRPIREPGKAAPARALAQQSDWRGNRETSPPCLLFHRCGAGNGLETAELPWTARTSF